MKRKSIKWTLAILFCIPVFLSGQQGWYLCDGEDNNNAEMTTWQGLVVDKSAPDKTFYYLNFDVLVKYPSCPFAKDGFIEVRSVYTKDSNSRRFESTDFNPQFIFLGDDEAGFSIQKTQKAMNLGFTDMTLVIQVANRQTSITNFEFPPERFVEDELILLESGNETCPGTADGFALLKRYDYNDRRIEDLVFPDNYIQWEDGFIGSSRNDLTAGTHNFQRRYENYNNLCCLDGRITINSNACYTALLEESFASQVPGSWFINPPGAFRNENNIGVFREEGCVFIPFNLESQDRAVSVKLNILGEADISIIDMQMNPLASKSVSGDGEEHTLILNESDIKGFYLKIAGKQGTAIDNLSLFRFEEEVEEISASFKSEPLVDKSIARDTVCVGDALVPLDGLSLSGGISPLAFSWDLDGDGVFEDADSLAPVIQFDVSGDYNIQLNITDAIGQSTTIDYEYEAQHGHSLALGVSDLDLDHEGVLEFTVCQSTGSFILETLSGEGILSSAGPGLNGNTFDPSQAGTGEHIVEAHGGACDRPSIAIINVINEAMIEVEELSVIYQCEDIVQLDALLLNAIDGIWFVNDTLAILNDTLVPADLEPGMISLTFEAGADFCNPSYSIDVAIQEAPLAELEETVLDIFTDDPVYDLNSLLSSAASLEGIWSGPNVEDGRFFNPEGLTPGSYTLNYTVGEGICQRAATLSVNVFMSTSVYGLEEVHAIELYPNPAVHSLSICLEDTEAYPSLKARIYNLDGRLVLEQALSSKCTTVDLEHLESGLYIVSLTGSNTAVMGMTKLLKM